MNAWISITIGIALMTISIGTLYQRRKLNEAKSHGLWPEPGRVPTVEDVRRLAQAGETILAIKLYRRIDRVSLAEAKLAVERLAA